MAKIKTIQLSNGFKRFQDLTIDLGDNPPRVVALVGQNGCGKSSVFDGILLRMSYYSGQIGDRHIRNNIKKFSRNDTDYDAYRNINIILDKGEITDYIQTKDIRSTMISFRSPHRHNGELKIATIDAGKDIKLNNIGASATDELDAKIFENYKQLWSKYTTIQNSKDLRPSETRDHVLKEINASLEACLDLKLNDIGDIFKADGTLYFTKKDQTGKFNFNVLSSGEKEVIDAILDIWLKKEDYNDTIYLIDEPELHLNTSIQEKFLKEIIRLIPEDCQLWIATHSIGFIKAIKDIEDSAIINFEGNYASEPTTLRPMPKTRENWKKIFRIALDDMVDLLYPKQIIYCEGKIDANKKTGKDDGFDAAIYNQIFAETKPDVLFVSSGGQDQPKQNSELALKIIQKAMLDTEVLVLRDMDIKEGETTEQDKLIWLKKNKNNRMLKRKEIENYLIDFEIFSKLYNEYRGKDSIKYPEYDKEAYIRKLGEFDNDPKDQFKKLKTDVFKLGSCTDEKFGLQLAKYITIDTGVYQELYECIFNETSQPDSSCA